MGASKLAAAAIAGIGALLSIAAWPRPGLADVAPFYAGRTVTFVSGSSPGGSYDIGSRLIARHLGRHIPGRPIIIVQNMPGAGSMAAANHLYNVAPRDGSVIGMFGRGLFLDALFEAPSVRFDPLKFNWIGSHAKEVSMLLSARASGFRSVADVKARKMVTGSAPPGSDSHAFALLLNTLVGARLKLVSGYRGMAEAIMAIDRGEVEANAGASIGTLMGLRPQWLKEPGHVNIILQLAIEPHPVYLRGVPLAVDHALSPLDAGALRLSLSRLSIAYAFTAPPDVPADRVEALRAAFDAAVADPEFLADAERANTDVSPVSGAGVLDVIRRAYATPKDVIARARSATVQ